MSLYDKASLILPVSPAYKDGALQSYKPLTSEGTFTFSRGSNLAATRVDVNGLIEKGRENLLLNSVWNGAVANVAPTNYTVTSFASGTFDVGSQENSIRFTSPTSADRIMIKQSPAITGVVTGSVYVEQIHSGSITVADVIARAGGSSSVIAFMEDGVVVNNSNLVSAGKTYSLSINVTSAVRFRFGIGTSGPTTGDITLSKPQVEQGMVATDYIETGASTAQAGILEDLPRLDYSGGASCPALLLEPQRTNLIPYSELIDNWQSVSNLFVETNTTETLSPEGLYNATKLTATNNDPLIYQSLNVTADPYTMSFYVKGVGDSIGKVGRILFWYASSATGTTTSHDFTLTDDWQRVEATTTPTGAGALFFRIDIPADTSVAGDEAYIYGIQVEAGSYPTSYIPTYGTTVTRAADYCYNLDGMASIIGQNEGTIFCEFNLLSNEDSDHRLSISSGTSVDWIFVAIPEDGVNTRMYVRINGVAVIDIDSNQFVKGNTYKIAFAYKSGDSAIYINGNPEITSSTAFGSPSVTLDTFGISGSNAGSNTPQNLSNSIKQVALFKTRLTNAELAALTTI